MCFRQLQYNKMMKSVFVGAPQPSALLSVPDPNCVECLENALMGLEFI